MALNAERVEETSYIQVYGRVPVEQGTPSHCCDSEDMLRGGSCGQVPDTAQQLQTPKHTVRCWGQVQGAKAPLTSWGGCTQPSQRLESEVLWVPADEHTLPSSIPDAGIHSGATALEPLC